jgi:hypothetical protein
MQEEFLTKTKTELISRQKFGHYKTLNRRKKTFFQIKKYQPNEFLNNTNITNSSIRVLICRLFLTFNLLTKILQNAP